VCREEDSIGFVLYAKRRNVNTGYKVKRIANKMKSVNSTGSKLSFLSRLRELSVHY
jgi:hypothetical protein